MSRRHVGLGTVTEVAFDGQNRQNGKVCSHRRDLHAGMERGLLPVGRMPGKTRLVKLIRILAWGESWGCIAGDIGGHEV